MEEGGVSADEDYSIIPIEYRLYTYMCTILFYCVEKDGDDESYAPRARDGDGRTSTTDRDKKVTCRRRI